ncbi:MAG: Gfo/Idh/MocA family protein [Opitutales bacterium]
MAPYPGFTIQESIREPGSDRPVPIAVIGAGILATQIVFPSLALIKNARLVAVCDLDRARAADRARCYGAEQVFTSADDLLEAKVADGVVICASQAVYMELAPRFLRAGVAVYVEKPPADSAAYYLPAARASLESGKLLMTAFKKRYAPLYVKMKEVIERAEFGQPSALSLQRSFAGLGGGFLLGFGIHAIDLAPWLMGSRVASVSALSPDENTWSIQLCFDSGAVGSMILSGSGHRSYPDDQVTVFGETCTSQMVFVRDYQSLHYAHDGRTEVLHQVNLAVQGTHTQNGQIEAGFQPELQAFVDAIATGDATLIKSDARETYETMLVYDACLASAESGKRIALDYSGL